jgi:diguanylate cyclase (GGDEF)-like protein/PAS domain S-box-containing protein
MNLKMNRNSSSVNKIITQQMLVNQRIKLMYQHFGTSFPANLICATLLLAGLYKTINIQFLLAWYLAIIIISLMRIGLLIGYRHNPQHDNLHLRLFIIGTWLSAAMWGIAGSMLMPQHDILGQLLIIVIIAGVTTGALQTLRESFAASFGYIIFSIVPLIIWLSLQPNSVYLLITLSVLTYFLFLTAVAWQGYQIVLEMLSLRFKNIELVDDLSKGNDYLKNTNQSLIESQRLFQSAFDFAAIGMGLASIQGRWIKVNQSLCKLVGYTENELLDTDFRSIIYPDDLNNDLHYMQQILTGNIPAYKIEKRYIHKNGSLIWVLLNVSLVRDLKNEPLYFIAQIQNINAQKNAEKELEQMAYHDPLTTLDNRAQLKKHVNEAIINSKESDKKFAFIMLDLDHFKHINDLLGHDAGDKLLQEFSKKLKSSVRYTDKVTRLGGDEFVIIILDILDENMVINIAQKILDVTSRPMTIKGHTIYTTTSMGISIYPNDGRDMTTLMNNADLCLYRAKKIGRNNYQFCTTEIQSTVQEKILREQSIREALLNNEFRIYYQPIMNMVDSNINGFEALLRWKSKKYGDVRPEEIIPLAEQTNLIDALSILIFKTVSKQIKAWNTNEHNVITISINLSFREFSQINFVERVAEFLKINEIPKNRLEFEINENILMQDPATHIPIIHALKNLGVQISVDDFGTSYSSLDYLQKFSVDRIKIDRSFIKEITYNDKSRSIVKAIIAMSFELGIKTVATGVETIEQYDFLSQHGCNEIQGYYLSEPLSPELASKFLQEKLYF